MTRRSRTPTTLAPQGQLSRGGARILDATEHDPYHRPGHYAEPSHCEACGAVLQHGRWSWHTAQPGSHATVCPACARVRDHLPAGRVTLSGAYANAHRDELLKIARHQAELERREHALNRIMRIDEQADGVEISTTDVHLPRRIGTALKRAHDGELKIDFAGDEYGVRVHWQR